MHYKIYTIKSRSHPDLQYIGSTKKSLKERLNRHKFNYKKYLNGKYCFVTSFNILKYNDYYIELYCETGTDDKTDAHWLEGQVIRSEKCVNKIVPGRTRKEYREKYRENNIDKFKEYQKKYYQQNIDIFKKYNKKYYQQNIDRIKKYNKQQITCECGSKITLPNRARHVKTKKHINFI